MDKSLLEKIGLTKGEIKVYLALLDLGETTTGNIIKRSRVSSSKVYNILEKLIRKGLVSFIIKERTKWFKASSPRKILEYLEDKEKKLKENKRKLSNLIIELEKREKPPKYRTTIYKGVEGYRTVINGLSRDMTKKDEWLALGISQKRPESILFLWDKFNTIRKKKKVRARFLFADIESKKKFKKLPLSQGKVINTSGVIPIGILKDKTLIFNWKELSVIEIINQDIADAFQEYFEVMWKSTKKR